MGPTSCLSCPILDKRHSYSDRKMNLVNWLSAKPYNKVSYNNSSYEDTLDNRNTESYPRIHDQRDYHRDRLLRLFSLERDCFIPGYDLESPVPVYLGFLHRVHPFTALPDV